LKELNVQNPDVETAMSLHWVANWPIGLQTLLHHGFTGVSQQSQLYWGPFNGSPLDWAIKFHNIESVKILMKHLAFYTRITWYCAVNWGNPYILREVASGLYQKFTQSVENLPPRGSCAKPTDVIDNRRLYCTWRMSLEAAQILYDAGFTTVDEPWFERTPLMTHAESYDMNDAPTVVWFLEKGAKLDTMCLFGLMPLHVFAEKFVVSFIRREHDYQTYKSRMGWNSFLHPDQPTVLHTSMLEVCPIGWCDEKVSEDWSLDATTIHEDLFTAVFENKSKDSCTCQCAMQGCTAISSALRVSRPTGCVHQILITGRKITTPLQKRTLHEIVTYLSGPEHHARICCEALRIMTFDALGLTHTCHDWGYCHKGGDVSIRPSFPSSEDIKNIEYTEVNDIQLLENLMAEFESAWKEWNGEVLDFIENYWEVRMEEIMSEREKPRSDELQRLEEVGVVVKGYGPELPLPVEEQTWWQRDCWAEFEEEVEKIMNGEY
jgi:hypothetical protein